MTATSQAMRQRPFGKTGLTTPELMLGGGFVGGIMINDKQEILLIQERRAVESGDQKWKFPGGYVDQGETIKQGVEREVSEETGVKGEF